MGYKDTWHELKKLNKVSRGKLIWTWINRWENEQQQEGWARAPRDALLRLKDSSASTPIYT